jgi:hypothetical protein
MSCRPRWLGNGHLHVEALNDANYERHEEMLNWIGDFDPQAFSVDIGTGCSRPEQSRRQPYRFSRPLRRNKGQMVKGVWSVLQLCAHRRSACSDKWIAIHRERGFRCVWGAQEVFVLPVEQLLNFLSDHWMRRGQIAIGRPHPPFVFVYRALVRR